VRWSKRQGSAIGAFQDDLIDAQTTAVYIREVLAGDRPVPRSMALQVEHILQLAQST